MNIVKNLCVITGLLTSAHLLGDVEVPSYVMVGLHDNKYGSLYRSMDFGKTWQQIDNKAGVNYVLTVSADNRVYYRNINDDVNSCPALPEDKSNCDGRFRGFKTRNLAADNTGIFYLSRNDDIIHVGANPDWTQTYGLKGPWSAQGCGYHVKNIAKGIAPINDFRTFYVNRNAPNIWLFPAQHCKDITQVYEGTDVQAIAASPNGELYIIDNTNKDGRWRLYHRWWSDGHVEEIGIDFTDVAIAPEGTIFGLKGNRELWNSKDYGKTWNLVASNLPIDRIAIQPAFSGSTSQNCDTWCNENINEPNDFNITKGICKKVCTEFGQLSETNDNDTNRLIEDLKICTTTNNDLRQSIVDAIYQIGTATKYADKTDIAIKKALIIIEKLQISLRNCGAASNCDGSSSSSRGYTKTAKFPTSGPSSACTKCTIDTTSSKAAAMVAHAKCLDQMPGLEWLFDYLNGELNLCVGAATAKSGELSTLTNKLNCLKADLDDCINS